MTKIIYEYEDGGQAVFERHENGTWYWHDMAFGPVALAKWLAEQINGTYMLPKPEAQATPGGEDA